MVYITIYDRAGKNPPCMKQVSKESILLGRWSGGDVILEKKNVSKKHARLLHKEGRLLITDLQSTNHTYVNGRAIAPSSPHALKENDRVSIGDYIIDFSIKPPANAPPPKLQQPSESPRSQKVTPPPIPRQPQPSRGLTPKGPPPPPQTALWHSVAMASGPSYSFTAIPQGWLLLAPSGHISFISDPQHQQAPAATSAPSQSSQFLVG